MLGIAVCTELVCDCHCLRGYVNRSVSYVSFMPHQQLACSNNVCTSYAHNRLNKNLCFAGRVAVIVNFQCDVNGEPNYVKPAYIGSSDNVYLFDMMTPRACAPELVVDCLVYGPNGQKYDLSPLIRRSDNWLIFNTNRTEKFYINVCHALNPFNGSRCSG